MDEHKLNTFLGQVLHDLGGAFGIALVRMGRQLGLYEALRTHGPLNSAALAQEAGLAERYVREWLSYHAASNYVSYDPTTQQFALTAEQAAVFADEDSPSYLVDAFDAAAAYLGNQDKVQAAFRTGGGVGWAHQTNCLFCAVARFFRPGYLVHLIDNWLPALDGVLEKLSDGAKVADVGCGHGYTTVLMAKAFPDSEFVGFDFHPESICEARKHAKAHGLTDNIRFEVGAAAEYPGTDYDLVTFFDCLHDMGDPTGAAAHVRGSLKPDGCWMIVEPFAYDTLEENLNPVGRLYYAASTMVCVPASLDQEVGAALGAQAGERRLREVVTGGGFRTLRRAIETPFNLVLEATC
ncbi:class I SAM-dependent methyltransferase [Mycolicibacterium sp. XJ2546]